MISKKIGVITFHFCMNYGALLQNYALVEYLKKNGMDAYTLNAVSIKQKKNNSIYGAKNGLKKVIRNIILFPLHKKRVAQRRKFQIFKDKYLNCTNLVSNSKELCELINNSGFDDVITGSDQVWNPKNHDFEDMFFFPFKTKAKKYGYAVSLGEAEENDLDLYGKYISEFESIGVREKDSVNLIRKYNDSTIETIDPVLLLSNKKWSEMATQCTKVISKPYLICYFISKENIDKYYKLAQKCADELGIDLYMINSNYSKYSYYKNNMLDVGPQDFVGLISNANFVCTDSFHGTVFSVIMNTPFISFIKSTSTTDSRVKNFLTTMKLEKRIVFGNLIEKNSYLICKDEICFDDVNSMLELISNKSKEYLKDIINN